MRRMMLTGTNKKLDKSLMQVNEPNLVRLKILLYHGGFGFSIYASALVLYFRISKQ
jgi:uncharacterized protein YggT (Ycf19 family)